MDAIGSYNDHPFVVTIANICNIKSLTIRVNSSFEDTIPTLATANASRNSSQLNDDRNTIRIPIKNSFDKPLYLTSVNPNNIRNRSGVIYELALIN